MEKNEYRLVISLDSSIGGKSPITQKSDKKTDSATKGLTALAVYQYAQPFINATKQVISNEVNTTYGSGELTARINLAMDAVSFAAKTAVGVASGKSLASMLGLSSGAGAVIGAVVAVGSEIVNLAVKQNTLNNQIKIENEQLQILRGRAGIQYNRSRSGE